jgi:hypothetical protein
MMASVSDSYLQFLQWLKDKKYDITKEQAGIPDNIEAMVLYDATNHPWNYKMRKRNI